MNLTWMKLDYLPTEIAPRGFENAYCCTDYPVFILHSSRFPGVGYANWYLTAWLDESKQAILINETNGVGDKFFKPSTTQMDRVYEWAGKEISRATDENPVINLLAMTSEPIRIVLRGELPRNMPPINQTADSHTPPKKNKKHTANKRTQ